MRPVLKRHPHCRWVDHRQVKYLNNRLEAVASRCNRAFESMQPVCTMKFNCVRISAQKQVEEIQRQTTVKKCEGQDA
jgi:transposase-like protein